MPVSDVIHTYPDDFHARYPTHCMYGCRVPQTEVVRAVKTKHQLVYMYHWKLQDWFTVYSGDVLILQHLFHHNRQPSILFNLINFLIQKYWQEVMPTTIALMNYIFPLVE